MIANFQDYTNVHVVVITSLGVDWVRSKDDTRHCDKDSGDRNQPDVAFPFAELHPHFLHKGSQGQVLKTAVLAGCDFTPNPNFPRRGGRDFSSGIKGVLGIYLLLFTDGVAQLTEQLHLLIDSIIKS